MKQLKRFLPILGCILSSIYLTYILGQNALATKLHIGFAFIYFLIIGGIILYCYEKFLAKKITRIYDRKIIVISFLFTLLIIISNYNGMLPKLYLDNQIIIEATGEKDIKSNGAEVWVTKISVDKNNIDLSEIPLSSGWEYKSDSNTIFINASENSKQPLSLDLPKGDQIEILFVKHGWSGIVNISDGSETSTVDLYDLNGSTYSHNISGRSYCFPNYLNVLLIIGSMILIYFLIFLGLKISLKNSKCSILLNLAMTIIIFKNTLININNFSFIILLLIIAFISIFNLTFQNNIIDIFNYNSLCDDRIKKYYTRGGILGIVLIGTYSAFASIGYQLFLSGDLINITASRFALFILCIIWFIPIILFVLFILEFLSNKFINNNMKNNKQSNKKAAISFFLILFTVWEIILLGYFPANMTSDSIDQWAQAIGILPIGNAHPAFHTIIIKILATIIESPFWIVSIQVICMAAVCTSFLMLLFKRGIKFNWLCIIALIYAIMPNNFMFVTTLWKDIPYSISLLWLTYLLGKMSQSPKKFFSKNSSIIILSLSIISVRFFRHNGIIPYFLMIILLIYITFKYFVDIKFRSMHVLILTVLLTLLINGPIFKFFQVQTNPQSKPYATMFAALGSAVNKNRDFSYETTEILESIMTLEDWKEYYNRFNIDSYSFWHEGGMNLSNITFKQAFSAYLEGVFKYPDIIIKDRLDGMNLLWDITQPPESFNHRYAAGMWFPSSIDPSIFNLEFTDKENHVYMPDNLIVKLTNIILGGVQRIPLADIFFYRSGVYIILFFILLLYALKNKLYRIFWISIPFIGNTISWILLLSHQSYRYVYYVAPCVIGICIFIVTSQTKENKKPFI